ncbi:hypothetical protein ACFOTA_22930 [Chitinophaga sp. GCM10012297]|uniref:DUF3471 domain-containing protein n=1 Tax=Chitinophaga chungangae TaxID=2821488 RepID=A0ABS3YK67_9BACT|nr:hypothetical protein [Chitinophaga chungangae]MBO9155087.1 hypothetical protein [Chitinophaga chungangae]
MSRILLLALIVFMTACKSKPKPATGDEEQALTYPDFRRLFPEAALTFRWDADSLGIRQPDSIALKARVVKQFLPDTLAKGVFAAAEKPKFFALGLIQPPNRQFDILVVEGSARSGAAAWLVMFNKNGEFLGRHLVARNTKGKRMGFSVDKRLAIKVTTETASKSIREDVYAAEEDGNLALILTNSTEPVGGLYNPIDTLPRKHKFSGNYMSGENIVSVRDGETAKEFLFFIHFSRDKGECIGELDGTGRFTSATTGQFRDKQSSCILDFKFSSGRVTIRETGCGAYRGIRCMFEGTFVRKKSK